MAVCVGLLVTYFDTANKSEEQNKQGIYVAAGLLIICLLKAVLFNGYDMYSSHLAMKMRVAICNLIYKKV